MKSYEVIREIPNQCSNNQMRDVFFDEIECESPLEYVKSVFPDKDIEITEETNPDGAITIHVLVNGLTNIYRFSEI